MDGIIYLLHFDQPYKHARHYIGWTANLEQRWASHGTAKGARLLHVIAQAGISWQLVALWEGSRDDERQLKNWKATVRICPVCQAQPQKVAFIRSLPLEAYKQYLVPKSAPRFLPEKLAKTQQDALKAGKAKKPTTRAEARAKRAKALDVFTQLANVARVSVIKYGEGYALRIKLYEKSDKLLPKSIDDVPVRVEVV